MSSRKPHRRPRLLGLAALFALVTGLGVGGGPAASAPQRATQQTVEITVNTLPISNGYPLDIGIRHGFFQKRGISIRKVTLQSGNDIVLALANNSGQIGYIGYVPAMIGRTQGIPITIIAASDVEGTNVNDNWQNTLVRGNSSIRTVADLRGKTIAVNALKGVGEVMIKAALRKRGVDPNAVNLLAMPFPTMRTALRNGQVDAIWTPEPFNTQAINLDGARIVMAPGPVLGRFWPIGCYAARTDWVGRNPALVRRFQAAMNEALRYAQTHSDEMRTLLPAGTQNVRLPIWSPLADRQQLLELARYSKDFGVINTLPNFTQLLSPGITAGQTLQGSVGRRFIVLRRDGRAVTRLTAGTYTFVVADTSNAQNFRLTGPGVNRRTSVRGTGRSTWTLRLRRGVYTYSSSARPSLKRTFRVR
jgi:NitT/TauT family transport system substrate-binding protein